jgi:hypothetical protein
MPDDDQKYRLWLESREKAQDAACLRCGACCGAMDDPCEHLYREETGTYACHVYETRLGEHRTLSGKTFRCVPIREKKGQSWPGDEQCGYKQRNARCLI